MRKRISVLCLVVAACAAPNGIPSPTGAGAVVTTTQVTTPTTDMPPWTSAVETPADLVDRITSHASENLGVPEDQIEVTRAEAAEWPDGSLGCPEPGMVYTQAVVRGYVVELQVGELVYNYRTDAEGVFRLCTTYEVSPPSETPPVGGESTESGYETGGDS